MYIELKTLKLPEVTTNFFFQFELSLNSFLKGIGLTASSLTLVYLWYVNLKKNYHLFKFQ